MNRLVSQAELRALQSQINPHFLFNALNTLYGTIPREAAGRAAWCSTWRKSSATSCNRTRPSCRWREEMQIVRAYLEVEQLRLGDRLTSGDSGGRRGAGDADSRALDAAAGGERDQARRRAKRGARATCACGSNCAATSCALWWRTAAADATGSERRRGRAGECAAASGDLLRTRTQRFDWSQIHRRLLLKSAFR